MGLLNIFAITGGSGTGSGNGKVAGDEFSGGVRTMDSEMSNDWVAIFEMMKGYS